MNIAYKIMTNKNVSDAEIKFLLWMILCELQLETNKETVGDIDNEECFNIDDMLDYLEGELSSRRQ
jgi:hypothetical protein